MAKYSKKAGEKVKKEIHEKKEGTLNSGRSGKKVTNKKASTYRGTVGSQKKGC